MMLFFTKMIARNGPPRGRSHSFFVRNNYSTMTARPATSSSLFNTTTARSSSISTTPLSLQNLAVAHNHYSLATYSDRINMMGGADENTIAVNYHYQQCNTFSTTTRRRRIIRNRTTGNDNPANEDDYSSSSNHHGGDGGMTRASTGMLSTEQFLIVANELLNKVEVAVTKLKDCNEGIEIIRYPRGTISDDTTATAAAATTAYSNVDDDDDENTTSTIIRHDGRLSIQIMSTGDLFYGGGTYWLTIHADYYGDDDASGGGNDSSSDVPPGSSSTTNGNNYGGNNYITLQSPLSGSYMYIYNVITKEWVGSEDGHSLYGMFTRDWIRQCSGVPDL